VLAHLLAATLAALPAPSTPAPAPAGRGSAGRTVLTVLAAGAPRQAVPRPPRLAEALLAAVVEAAIQELHDAGPEEGTCPGAPACPWPLPQVAAPLHLDLAVIRLDEAGRAVEAANVIVDPSAPLGQAVRLDRNLAATGVRFRRWSPERRETPVSVPFADADDLSPRHGRGLDFMAPYPASLFKLLVAFHVEKRVAEGALWSGEVVGEAWRPPGSLGRFQPPEARPLSEWVERMITESDNRATMAVLRHLHARGEVTRLNAGLARLGLETLQVEGTLPADGGRWAPGEIQATAMDVARLLWLVAGGPGVLWRTPAGEPVTREELPEPARQRLQALLADQAMHEALSSGSLCGAVPPGIPALVPGRFLDPASGLEAAGGQAWGRDVRPCNARAEVRFLHKTGLTWNYASDAGLVEPLPGKPWRRYVVALVSAAGTRFVDPERATALRHPCEEAAVCVNRRLSRLGAAIDAWAIQAAAWDARRR